MKKIYIIGLCCLLAVSGYSQIPTDTIKVSLQHTEDYGLVLDTIGFFPRNAAQDFENTITSMHVDDDENIYVLGKMRERFSPEFKPSFISYQLTPVQLSPRKSGGTPNIFIAKYDRNLQLIWVKSINSTAKLHIKSKLLIDKQNNTAYFHFLYEDIDQKIKGDPFAPIYHENTKILEFSNLGYFASNGEERRTTSILLKFNMEDGSLECAKEVPVLYSGNLKFNIDNNGNIYMSNSIDTETNVNFYPGESEINFIIPENIGKHYEEWIRNHIIVKYDRDMRYLSGFQIKDANTGIDEIKIDAEENIYIAGRGSTSPITLIDPETDETISLRLRGTTKGFIVKYAHKGNNTYSIDWAKSKSSVGFYEGSITFNEENLPAIPGLVSADDESIYLFDENMQPQNRLFKHEADADLKFSCNELFVKKADIIPTSYSLPLENDACIPESMDYVSFANLQVPGRGNYVKYVYPFFLFSLDENNMLKWKLNKTSYSGNPVPSGIYPNDFHITGDKRVYVTGEVSGKIDLDPAEPSKGLYFETDNWNVIGGGTGFLARYIETYRVKAGDEIQNGAILFDASMVRNGGSCTITVVPSNGYTLESGSLSATNGIITPNADGTYTLSGVTKPVVVMANFSALSTAIDEMPARDKTVTGYYTILGQKLMNEPAEGMYIILYDDGTSEKIKK
ncbi:MAG: hypothetical protein LBR52_04805 [Prevotellaceae bacterium]|jgi:hypothetical protein|nr:hypothetical protein [Prevotellaceae bacterium]